MTIYMWSLKIEITRINFDMILIIYLFHQNYKKKILSNSLENLIRAIKNSFFFSIEYSIFSCTITLWHLLVFIRHINQKSFFVISIHWKQKENIPFVYILDVDVYHTKTMQEYYIKCFINHYSNELRADRLDG